MIYRLNDDLKTLDDMSLSFARKELAADREKNDAYPFGPLFENVLKKAHDVGFLQLMLPDDMARRSIYFAFAPGLSDADIVYDASGSPTRLDEQIPGSCHDYVSIGDWIAVTGRRRSMLLLSPDAPMMQCGGFSYLRLRDRPRGPGEPAHLISWPVNNHWEVNFPARQGGPLTLRYTIRLLPGDADAATIRAESDRLGGDVCYFPLLRWSPSVRGA